MASGVHGGLGRRVPAVVNLPWEQHHLRALSTSQAPHKGLVNAGSARSANCRDGNHAGL